MLLTLIMNNKGYLSIDRESLAYANVSVDCLDILKYINNRDKKKSTS